MSGRVFLEPNVLAFTPQQLARVRHLLEEQWVGAVQDCDAQVPPWFERTQVRLQTGHSRGGGEVAGPGPHADVRSGDADVDGVPSAGRDTGR